MHGWRKDVPPEERRLRGSERDGDDDDWRIEVGSSQERNLLELKSIERRVDYKTGVEATTQGRAQKLVDGLRNDVEQFSKSVAFRAGVFRKESPTSIDNAAPDKVDSSFWVSNITYGIFTRGKLKGIGQKMRTLKIIVDAMSGVDDEYNFETKYATILRDMTKYGMLREMNRYRISV